MSSEETYELPVWSNAVLAACSEASRAELYRRGTIVRCGAEQLLYEAGQEAGVVLFPLTGTWRASKTEAGGRRQILCHMRGGTCSGICVLTMAERCLADVRAIQPSEVLVVSRADFQAIARADPVVCQSGWQAAIACMTHFSELVEHLSFHTVAERVALLLIEYSQKDGDLVRMTQTEMAAEVGTTREVVARCLAALQAGGAVLLGRARITVRSRAKLQQSLE